MSAWIGSILFVVAITAAIALHEWGHFLTARRFGMRAERFFIGFGPTLWSTQRGETEYGVKWFPIGGFVRIAGMSPTDERRQPVADVVFERDAVARDRDEAARSEGSPLADVPAVPTATWRRLRVELAERGLPPEDRDALAAATMHRAGPAPTPDEAARALQAVSADLLAETGRVGDARHRVLRGDDGRFFHDRPAWQRAIVLSAGSGMHFLQAIVLLFIAFWAFGTDAVPVVDAVLPDTPAAEAGLAEGDEIVAVDGQPVRTFDEARALIGAEPGTPVVLTIEGSSGVRRDLRLTTQIVVSDLLEASALAEAGMLPGDRLVSVGGREVSEVSDIRAGSPGPGGAAAQPGGGAGASPTGSGGRPAEDGVPVVLERVTSAEGATEQVDVELTAAQVYDLAEQVRGLAGFVPAAAPIGPLEAVRETFAGEAGFPALVAGTVTALGEVFGPEGLSAIPAQLAGGERDPAGGASLVGITVLAGEGTAQAGWFFLLGIVASLNVFVGIFNLLPLPPLDGGHLAVLGVERSVNLVRQVRGQRPDYRIDPRTVTAIAIPVIVLIGLVALAFIVLDITNPLQLPQ